MKPRLRLGLLSSCDLLYDLFCATVNVLDVASDLIVCAQFYLDDKLVFFWLCVTVFVIAHICYAVLFTRLYGMFFNKPACTRVYSILACFTLILPFGQFVPLIVWIGSFKFQWFDKVCAKLGLEIRDDVRTEVASSEDRLQKFISTKIVAHGGFLIESLVESVPQSIFQMIAIVIYNQTNFISIISLTISIISVSSRGIMLSYSIHRPTFLFNFTCFVADVVRVFCVVSWLFFQNSGSNFHTTIFLLANPIDDLFTYIWWWKEIVVIIIALIGVILFWFGLGYHFWTETASDRVHKQYRTTCLVVMDWIMFGMFFLIVFIPSLIVLEAMLCSSFPLFVFRTLSLETANNTKVYNEILNWLIYSPVNKKEKERRLLYLERYYAQQYVDTHPLFLSEKKRKERIHKDERCTNYDLALSILKSEKKQKKQKWWYVIIQWLRAFSCAVQKEAKSKYEDFGFPSMLFAFYSGYVGVPVMFLSAVYSLFYPFLCFATNSWSQLGLLQQFFSLVTLLLFFILLVLCYPVFQFYHLLSRVRRFSNPTATEIDTIKKQYEQRRFQSFYANQGTAVVLIANARANRKNDLVNHIVPVMPEISKFAGFLPEDIPSVEKFLSCPAFRTIVCEELTPINGSSSSSSSLGERKGLIPRLPSSLLHPVGNLDTQGKRKASIGNLVCVWSSKQGPSLSSLSVSSDGEDSSLLPDPNEVQIHVQPLT